jgi:hypothetical protein
MREDNSPISFRTKRPEDKKLLNKMAQKRGLSVNTYIQEIVTQALKSERLRTSGGPPTLDMIHSAVARGINGLLLKNRDWLNEAVLDIELHKNAESIFGKRFDDYKEEKIALAAQFMPLLLARILRILRQGRRVVLVIDSGTTTYWAMRQLAGNLIQCCRDVDAIFRELVIITNNLAGVDCFVTFSRLNPFVPKDEPESTTLSEFVECWVLTGRVLSKYAALTGTATEAALEGQKKFLNENGPRTGQKGVDNLSNGEPGRCNDPVFIGLLVGNWIRINEDGRHPIPVEPEPDKDRHAEFKQKMIEICDELYVISPLGKLFVGKTIAEINDGFRTVQQASCRDVHISRDKENAVKLVACTRPLGCLLWAHSIKVSNYGKAANEDVKKRFIGEEEIARVPSLLFPFDSLPETPSEQIEIEFPHEETRRGSEFMMRFFSVERNHLE